MSKFIVEAACLDAEDAERVRRARPELWDGPCPTCPGKESYVWREAERECNCAQQRQLAKVYTAAGIGATYQRLDWEDFRGDPQLIEDLRHYVRDCDQYYLPRGMGIIFSGSIGTGKTMMAHLVLKELVKMGHTGFSTTFAGTIEAFTAGWGDQGNKAWFAKKFMHSQVLVLDDLGREMRTGSQLPQSTFDLILRTRVHDARPVLLTTNMGMAELGRGYGAAVLSLLCEQSIIVDLDGDDWRENANHRAFDEIAKGEVRPIC